MSAFLRKLLVTGTTAAVASALTAAACSRLENKRAAPAINAISHIAWGGPPPADSGPAAQNFITGLALHVGASLFWATFFETLFGRGARQRRSLAWLGGAAVSAGAFITDYGIVSRRFRPGYEAYLSKPSLFGVYAALAAGMAIAARLDARMAPAGRRSSSRPRLDPSRRARAPVGASLARGAGAAALER